MAIRRVIRLEETLVASRDEGCRGTTWLGRIGTSLFRGRSRKLIYVPTLFEFFDSFGGSLNGAQGERACVLTCVLERLWQKPL